jgi:hypothetical protein
MTASAARAGALLAQENARRWTRSVRLEALFGSGDRYRIRDVGGDAVRIEWVALERTGSGRPVSVDVDVTTGAVSTGRPFAHWSALPTPGSRVIVVPDVVTYLSFEQAIGTESIFPYVVVVPLPGHVLPPEWCDRSYWRFDGVTVLSDRLSNPSPTAALLKSMLLGDATVAAPPGDKTWSAWASDSGTLSDDELSAIREAALPLSAFTSCCAEDDPDWVRRSCRTLDEEGRLCRLIDRGWTAQGTSLNPMLVRSDRTFAELGQLVKAQPVQGGGWRSGSASAFVDGASAPSSRSVGRSLADAFTPFVGDVEARTLAAYVALTFLFPAFDELPVLLIRGGSPSMRLSLRRLLAAVCNRPTVASRTRAAQLARIADAAPGVMILDEPCPLCGPSGLTEIGRFVVASALPDGSSYQTVTARRGLRQLDVFGPRIVLMAEGSAAGLPCTATAVGIGATDVDVPPFDRFASAALRDDLFHWSMAAFADIGECVPGVPADRVLTVLQEQLFEAEAVTVLMAEPSGIAAATPAERPEPTPADLMEDVIDACIDGCGHVAMTQVMLELASRGASGEVFSPERVGRWLAAHPRIDRDRPVERRRLYGQISRIYPVVTKDGVLGEAVDAFRFCTDRGCGDCPYDPICAATFPELQRRKQSI